MSVDNRNPEHLKRYLRKIDALFDVDRLMNDPVPRDAVVAYYRGSDLGYRIFHSSNGSIHMRLRPGDDTGQAALIQEEMTRCGARRVLELACGKGFNTLHLARRDPAIAFTGIDLTPDHVAAAQKKGRTVPNATFLQGDFHALPFPDGGFDLIFAVEGLCHATDMAQALSEARRLLRPGGVFVVIDGFRSADFDSFPADLKRAGRLVEAAMAVDRAWRTDEWEALCVNAGFTIGPCEDLSAAIMPDLLRLQFFARGFFKFPALSRLFLRSLPPHLTQNAIAGIFMPFCVGAGMQRYRKIVLFR